LYSHKYKKSLPWSKIVFISIFLCIVAVGFYIKFSPKFEHKPPTIDSADSLYWNLKDDIAIKLFDRSGIRRYDVALKVGEKEIVLEDKNVITMKQNIDLMLNSEYLDDIADNTSAKLVVRVVDSSSWNFFKGNEAIKTIDILIDKKKPDLSLIANSRYITRGGSAIAIVKLGDKNLKEAYLLFADDTKFELIPYIKEGYYISLFAWKIDIEEFKTTYVVAYDKANNRTKLKIPLYIRDRKIKTDKIKIGEKFIKTVSRDVLEQSSMTVPKDLTARFIKQNKDLRAENIATIQKQTIKHMDKTMVKEFHIKPFKRLDKSIKTAGFAERRHYYFNDEKINEAWHLGLDWASVRNAPIYSTNSGKVIFNDYLGIYGNSIIIDHGLGLASIYSHTSTQFVDIGDEIKSGQKIAKTGETGAVLGDHLHFGVLVQGIEVNPDEWTDKKWINKMILNTMKTSNEIIKDETK